MSKGFDKLAVIQVANEEGYRIIQSTGSAVKDVTKETVMLISDYIDKNQLHEIKYTLNDTVTYLKKADSALVCPSYDKVSCIPADPIPLIYMLAERLGVNKDSVTKTMESECVEIIQAMHSAIMGVLSSK